MRCLFQLPKLTYLNREREREKGNPAWKAVARKHTETVSRRLV